MAIQGLYHPISFEFALSDQPAPVLPGEGDFTVWSWPWLEESPALDFIPTSWIQAPSCHWAFAQAIPSPTCWNLIFHKIKGSDHMYFNNFSSFRCCPLDSNWVTRVLPRNRHIPGYLFSSYSCLHILGGDITDPTSTPTKSGGTNSDMPHTEVSALFIWEPKDFMTSLVIIWDWAKAQ